MIFIFNQTKLQVSIAVRYTSCGTRFPITSADTYNFYILT